MRANTYAIIDEPRPGALQKWVVNPIWPFFALMFAGSWLALPWFAFNGVAMGSATRRRELLVVLLATPLKVGLAIFMLMLHRKTGLPDEALRYFLVVVMTLKLGLGYWLFNLQQPSFNLYQYFDGPVRNGVFVVMGGALVHEPVMDLFGSNWLLRMLPW
ncbi:hypothetical protein HPC49_15115 [Pyxidicoccus fallax]|uniref:Uncharacterized protein n=1 Tax=Pyxidicoccus fallax TaxID=394095 RepID=A0A848LIV0_9BACT|nr:hypothetical protein [Pyxidicoccus fallax]NMO17649.1 hypothetical protein [Pyxidicoccus fallax]NPC79561.1 hypothetical protein [Pyxidicoccus fallax]